MRKNNTMIDTMKTFLKTLFNEMRVVTYKPSAEDPTDENLAVAVTANENLKTLGYTLKPQDIVKIAGSESVLTIYDDVKEFAGEVKAEPMYPDFPNQVLNMDEATFRFHQMVHYFSTYGIEALFGVKVSRGWLPDVERTEKTEKDESLLDLKVLELISDEDLYLVPVKRILSKRQRVTLPEKEILAEALPNIDPAELAEMSIPFKENLPQIFLLVCDMEDKTYAMEILKALCKHPGDVFKCIKRYLGGKKYRLTTSEKRFLVKLLESYPANSFSENLIPSRKKREEILVLLKHLDYNTYSRSAEHKLAVAQLRNGDLRSWEGQAKKKLTGHEDGALAFVAKRPGNMLRMLAWILRLGYGTEEILENLLPYAKSLSTQTLVATATAFGRGIAGKEETENILKMFLGLLKANLASKETPLKGKKVFLDMKEFALGSSEIQFNEASKEGGYIRSGLAYAIPEDVKTLRFFVYWNDEKRVDIDLHASAVNSRGMGVTVGWNSSFRDSGILHSGDITHSDAAEYIDVRIGETGDLEKVVLAIKSYTQQKFAEIDTCFTGMMAVNSAGEEVALYDPKNCFFTHELKSSCTIIHYAYIDLVSKCMVFCGKEDQNAYGEMPSISAFTLEHYIAILLAAQEASVVSEKEDADIVLTMGKSVEENGLSLIDSNYFAD